MVCADRYKDGMVIWLPRSSRSDFKVGQMVDLAMSGRSYLAIACVLFGLPICCIALSLGVVAWWFMPQPLADQHNDLAAFVGVLFGFVVGLALVSLHGRIYRPKLRLHHV